MRDAYSLRLTSTLEEIHSPPVCWSTLVRADARSILGGRVLLLPFREGIPDRDPCVARSLLQQSAGDMLRDQGELSQARRLYEQVLAVAPHDAHALAGLAGVLHDLGDEHGAQQRFEQGGRPYQARRQSCATS